MKILFICSGTHGILSPFVKEQMDSLSKLGIELSLFQINNKGLFGYLSHLIPLKKFIKKHNPDLIHAHYGLSGLLACLQNQTPIVVTYPGSDVNFKMNRFLSRIAMRFAKANIFVSENLLKIAACKRNVFVIPYGTNLKEIYPVNKSDAKLLMNFDKEENICLFSSSRFHVVKNFPLAQKVINTIGNIKLIELEKGYTREEINLIINSSDFLLLTSFTEGSPQVIKEAMACNRPIVATNVGDIEWLFGNTEGCYITSFDPLDVAGKIKLAIEFGKNKISTNGRERIIELGLDSENIAKKIIEVYKNVLHLNN